MAESLAITGLDHIVWETDLLSCMNISMGNRRVTNGSMRSKKQRQLSAVSTALLPENQPEGFNLLKRVSYASARSAVGRVNTQILERLRQVSADGHELVGMSSAPDFAVRQALGLLRDETGVIFNRSLTSRFHVLEGKPTAEFDLLNKASAVAGLLQETGLPHVEVGFIDGISDLEWFNAHCVSGFAVNPSIKLSKRMGPNVEPIYLNQHE